MRVSRGEEAGHVGGFKGGAGFTELVSVTKARDPPQNSASTQDSSGQLIAHMQTNKKSTPAILSHENMDCLSEQHCPSHREDQQPVTPMPDLTPFAGLPRHCHTHA